MTRPIYPYEKFQKKLRSQGKKEINRKEFRTELLKFRLSLADEKRIMKDMEEIGFIIVSGAKRIKIGLGI